MPTDEQYIPIGVIEKWVNLPENTPIGLKVTKHEIDMLFIAILRLEGWINGVQSAVKLLAAGNTTRAAKLIQEVESITAEDTHKRLMQLLGEAMKSTVESI